MLFSSLSFLFALPLVRSAVVRALHEGHSHEVPQALPGSWFQHQEHPVHKLFKRGPPTDGVNYAPVGTPQWSAGFPTPGPLPDPNTMPKEWIAALNAATAAGKIPAIPQSSGMPNTNPVYPQGVNPNSPQVCSATYKCRIPGDIWNAPDGVFASSFDDGPLPLTPQLVQFLGSHNVTTTHFMIGVNILYYPQQFLEAFNAGHDIAVHTWSHPYMTTLSNMDVVAQLGWTMQLIHNSTGGRVPLYWRPPYGDSDLRVTAIAREVFGLRTVIWNQDSEDWAAQQQQQILDLNARFLSGAKSPGLIILEHEVSIITVGGFQASFPLIASNGWSFRSLAEVISGGQSYQNSNSSTAIVTAKPIWNETLTSTTTTSTTSTSTTPTPVETSAAQNLKPTSTKSSAARSRDMASCTLMASTLLLSSLLVLFS